MSHDGLKTNRFKCPDLCALRASADRDLQPKWPSEWDTIVDPLVSLFVLILRTPACGRYLLRQIFSFTKS